VLSIWSAAPEEIEIRVQPVGEDGRPQGAPAKQPASLLKGQSNVEIAAGTAPGHRLRFTRGGRAFEVWANRGSWAAGPEGLEITRRPRGARAPEQFVAIDDVELALGYSASVESPAQDRPLILERSFGKPAGQGIRPEDKSALIVVARGTVGPVKLTVASRHGKALEYFDEALVLEEGWRRCPWRGFAPVMHQDGRSSHRGCRRPAGARSRSATWASARAARAWSAWIAAAIG
jgi:hypothetical protein